MRQAREQVTGIETTRCERREVPFGMHPRSRNVANNLHA
jgi:hypothetical protein